MLFSKSSLSNRMHPIHCCVPPEILESVIDELGRNSTKSKYRRTLQACALVSREFRNRAHHHLFSSINFVQRSYSTPSNILSRLWSFRELVHSGMKFPRLTGVLYHLRTLTIITDGSIFEAYATLKNEDMLEILREVRAHSKYIHTFTMQGSSFPIVWPNLTLDFRRALEDICGSSVNMTTLSLENMVGVPHTLFTETNIKHVRFHLIEFERPQTVFAIFEDCRLSHGQLESIDIDYTFPFPRSNLFDSHIAYNDAMKNYQSFFSGLKKLRFLIHRSDDLQRFITVSDNISSLENVDLEISNSNNGFLRTISSDLPLNGLPRLRRLVIRHKILVNITMRHPLFVVATILNSISASKSLRTIELFFEVSAHPPWTKPIHFFPDFKAWGMLDAALTQEHFGSVRNVILNLRYCPLQEKPWTFDEGIFTERCHKIYKGVFPLLSNSKSQKLALNVTFCPGGGKRGGH